MLRWEKALELEHYIRDYVPGAWKEPIHHVMFVPFVSEADIAMIEDGIIPDKLTKEPIVWAVRAYMMGSRKPCKTKEDLKRWLHGE